MKLIKTLLIMIIFITSSIQNVNAKDYSSSSIVMDLDSGRVLYENNPHEKKLIASTTKIMTAIIALEQGDLNQKITIGKEILKMYGTNIYIEVGEQMYLKDLIYGLLLRSGNDAAVSISVAISGNETKFVEEMNQKAKELGMKNTIFSNPHGLDEETKNYSTAYDMALLMKYAYQNEIYREISSTKKYETSTENKTYLWYNRNKLLTNYEYCTGGKNGYTPSAGKTLVSTATKNNLNLVAVSLNDSNIYQNHKNLFEKVFDKYKNYKIVDKTNFYIDENFVAENIYIKKDFNYPLTESEMDKIKTIISINNGSSNKKGTVKIYLDNQRIGSIQIYAKKTQKKEEKNFFSRLKSLIFR